MTTTRDLDAALRTLDPTTADDGDARAAADLERILATDPSALPQRARASQRPRARTARRVPVVGGLVAAATTGLLVLPPVLGGSSALATWTAYPTGLSPEQTATAAAGCRDVLSQSGGDLLRGLPDAETAITERRGQWTQVVLTGPDGFFASCLSTDPREDNFSAGAGDSSRIPGPRELTVLSFGTATLDAGDVSELTGRAGDDIITVTYPSEDHGDVVATVDKGAWTLWFPGDELEDVADPDGIAVRVGYQDGSIATITLLGTCDRGLTEELC